MAEVAATTAPATHSQPSRKGKKAWRKNVDLTALTAGLDAVRDEVIQTGGVIAEKDAEQLFATDVTGDAETARKQQGRKLLKSEEILARRSAVPGLDGRKRKADEMVAPVASGKRVKNGKYVSHKELQRLRQVADRAEGGLKVDHEAPTQDPWAATTVVKDPRLTFLDDQQAPKEPKTLKEAPLSLTSNGKSLPAVLKPNAGKSYNPLVGDWSALLEREGAAAVVTEQKRLAEEAAALAQEQSAEAVAAEVEAKEREEYATDYESAWESEWEGIQSGAEREEGHVQKPQRRKTQVERNKIKARKEREGLEKHERKLREREAQERRLEQIIKASKGSRSTHQIISAMESDADDSDSDSAQEEHLARRRFGTLPLPAAPLEVVLPDELQDSLRRLKPEGNLLTDRYRTLLVNGKVEMSRSRQKRMPKTDRTEKWSYKDWRLK